MKKIIFILLLQSIYSCNNINTPECNDENIKLEALTLFIEDSRPKLTEELINSQINLDDLKNYAWDNGLTTKGVINIEKKRIRKIVDSFLDINFTVNKLKLKKIRTEKIEDNIKKCYCAGVIEDESNFFNKLDLLYTAQITEDKLSEYYIEINYKE